jgi:gas vesicle protein GvpN
VLNISALHGRGEGYVAVHPNFRAIFTSNPTEYAGVYRTQDALLDRMITLRLDHYDRDTEIAITIAKSGLDRDRAARVVDLVRLCRAEGNEPNHHPTLRASIAIARVLAARGGEASPRNPVFLWTCRDVLRPAPPPGKSDRVVSAAFVDRLFKRLEGAGSAERTAARSRIGA